MHTVDRATDDDLQSILDWLHAESVEDGGEGFWCNRSVIERSHRELGELYVIRAGDEPVSFQVGKFEPAIVSTRKAFRGRGLAEAHLIAAIGRARGADVNLLEIECSPRTSWPFWQKRGFQRYGDQSEWADIKARLLLETRFSLPAGPRRPVRIDFYPEEAKYEEDVHALYGWSLDALLHPDGSYHLPQRVIGVCSDLENGKDLVVSLMVNGRTVYFDKAKYQAARDLGIVHDWRGGCFFLDRIRPASA